VEFNPSQFRLLLAGPKVSRLLPFVSGRGYVADACPGGTQAIDLLREEARHVLLVELELDDMLLADLLHAVRRENLAGAVILIDDPARSGMIISELVRGVDGYVATPPDELYLFRVIERQLLAQWALAHIGNVPTSEGKLRVVKSEYTEPQKVRQPAMDTPPRQEPAAAAAPALARSDVPSKVPAAPEKQDDDDWFDDAVALNVAPEARADAEPKVPSVDERTPPHGIRPVVPPDLSPEAKPVGAPPVAPKPKKAAEDDEDLFLDVDLEEPTASQGPLAVPKPVRMPR
jgi:DNA-binding NarL/FixJ family response regulator